jgi:hypothetical protein
LPFSTRHLLFPSDLHLLHVIEGTSNERSNDDELVSRIIKKDEEVVADRLQWLSDRNQDRVPEYFMTKIAMQ